jgi:flavin reductase
MTAMPPPPEPPVAPSLSAREFRDLMRHLASAVTIIASGRAGERSGLTATAVCSISDHPPMLLVCINRMAGSHEAIVKSRAFSVNVLGAADRDIATHFSGRTGRECGPSADIELALSQSAGAAVLATALASFDCEVEELKDVATHTIVIGRVVAGRIGPAGGALLYAHGAYWTPQA